MDGSDDAKAMFELGLELHQRAVGQWPLISGDEIADLHSLLEQTSDTDLIACFR